VGVVGQVEQSDYSSLFEAGEKQHQASSEKELSPELKQGVRKVLNYNMNKINTIYLYLEGKTEINDQELEWVKKLNQWEKDALKSYLEKVIENGGDFGKGLVEFNTKVISVMKDKEKRNLYCKFSDEITYNTFHPILEKSGLKGKELKMKLKEIHDKIELLRESINDPKKLVQRIDVVSSLNKFFEGIKNVSLEEYSKALQEVLQSLDLAGRELNKLVKQKKIDKKTYKKAMSIVKEAKEAVEQLNKNPYNTKAQKQLEECFRKLKVLTKEHPELSKIFGLVLLPVVRYNLANEINDFVNEVKSMNPPESVQQALNVLSMQVGLIQQWMIEILQEERERRMENESDKQETYQHDGDKYSFVFESEKKEIWKEETIEKKDRIPITTTQLRKMLNGAGREERRRILSSIIPTKI